MFHDMDVNADAQEVIKGLGDRIAALSIEIEILRVALKKTEEDLKTERTAANVMANRLLKHFSEAKEFSVDTHDDVGMIKP